MIDRIVGARRGIEGNGHLADDANLIIDSGQLRTRASAWDAVQAARNIKRPHTLDVITRVFDRFQELHGDRGFRDDPAIVGGIAELQGRPVVIVGEQKGASTEENIQRNFGMPHPEGYRKAIRLYRLAEKFHLPVITLVDTPGAYPGPEGRGRAISPRHGTTASAASARSPSPAPPPHHPRPSPGGASSRSCGGVRSVRARSHPRPRRRSGSAPG